MECEKCILEQRIQALEKNIEKNSEQHGEFYKRIGDLELLWARTDEKYSCIMSKIEEMSRILEELKNVPTKRWDSAVMAGITGIIGILIGIVFNGVG